MKFPFPLLTAAEAASLIDNGQNVGFSGFTPAGAPKAVPMAIAERAIAAHAAGQEFQIGVLTGASTGPRSEEHTSELQSLRHLVCRLLLEKKKTNTCVT